VRPKPCVCDCGALSLFVMGGKADKNGGKAVKGYGRQRKLK
jgi:hypothetical protein